MKKLEKYKKDLESLISSGDSLMLSMYSESYPEGFKTRLTESKIDHEKFIKILPKFRNEYQTWYSEAMTVVELLLPNRINDFTKLYQKPKARKEINNESYVIEDYLQGLSITRRNGEYIVEPKAAIPKFDQQLNILKSAQKRFESSLFEIKQVLQADLFDSELDAAMELNKKCFVRGAGAIAGVVLEHYLSQVCVNHNIKITKKNPTINDYNELLKSNNVIDISNWRYIQHLGDLRNLCDHHKGTEPTKEKINDLIQGVQKIVKTIF